MHMAIVGGALAANGATPMFGKRFADKSAPTGSLLHRSTVGVALATKLLPQPCATEVAPTKAGVLH